MPDVNYILYHVSPVVLLMMVFVVLLFMKWLRGLARTMVLAAVICGAFYLAAFAMKVAGMA